MPGFSEMNSTMVTPLQEMRNYQRSKDSTETHHWWNSFPQSTLHVDQAEPKISSAASCVLFCRHACAFVCSILEPGQPLNFDVELWREGGSEFL